jgi:hypothetical protein
MKLETAYRKNEKFSMQISLQQGKLRDELHQKDQKRKRLPKNHIPVQATPDQTTLHFCVGKQKNRASSMDTRFFC